MPKVGLQPYWALKDSSVVLYAGNALSVLKGLRAESVHMVVTSPPYWGQRDYEGGAEEIGAESDFETYVSNLTSVFNEARRVLRPEGTLWLNLGDKYLNGELQGLPWRVAFSLQGDGWILRQDVIWHKPDAMPTSVSNRCTPAHEYLFMLAKSKTYYYDSVAIKEKAGGHLTGGAMNYKDATGRKFLGQNRETRYLDANKRDVWTIPTGKGYGGNHFATFPLALVEPCIKAGTSEYGCCGECQAPFRRLTRETQLTRRRPNDYVKRKGEAGTGNACPNSVAGVRIETIGWEATCACGGMPGAEPCTVLDPFVGSGTTCDAALGLGRRSIGIDLNPTYLRDHAIPRCEGAILARPSLAALAPASEVIDLGNDPTGYEREA